MLRQDKVRVTMSTKLLKLQASGVDTSLDPVLKVILLVLLTGSNNRDAVVKAVRER
jgi:hypothetical protein